MPFTSKKWLTSSIIVHKSAGQNLDHHRRCCKTSRQDKNWEIDLRLAENNKNSLFSGSVGDGVCSGPVSVGYLCEWILEEKNIEICSIHTKSIDDELVILTSIQMCNIKREKGEVRWRAWVRAKQAVTSAPITGFDHIQYTAKLANKIYKSQSEIKWSELHHNYRWIDGKGEIDRERESGRSKLLLNFIANDKRRN